MAWKFPRHRIDSNNPTATDPVNENFNEISHESGKLNEHNFESNAVSSVGDMAAKAAFVVTQTGQEVDHKIVDGTAGSSNTDGDALIIGTTFAWHSVFSVSVTTEDSLLWAIASCQVWGIGSFAACALSIDGYVLPETIVGGVSQDNDPNGYGRGGSNCVDTVALDAIIPIAGGKHTVELVVRFKAEDTYQSFLSSFNSILNRELIAIEMRR